ncbi:hypothetical protein WA1_47000 [Scytonema hofmannii PCC 7110]|uniref:DUF6745 domain-containing protein n=1 Tax=Scytonema hofmannii PCC 7110 TaxID=128403 RepID=A0A139WXL0_9CYAN|nr:hypothetical protein [Scytonema hofmannii]KYC37181.1 hypothetical protein WA1_47000 [Scytonema hofmannii PCC 7110]
MSNQKIDKIAPKQEALISVYLDKWKKIIFSTEKIHRKKATKSLNKAYALNGLSKPRIIFLDSPAAIESIGLQVWIEPRGKLYSYLSSQFQNQIENPLWHIISAKLFHGSINEHALLINLYFPLESLIKNHLYRVDGYETFETKYWLAYSCLFDFCISVLNCAYPAEYWYIMQDVAENCGLIFGSESVAIICDRPTKISFDNQNRLHAEAEPAIQFSDGYSVYAYHGVIIPEKYGLSLPQKWQSEWILEEESAKLRHVLIQGIGYARICEELKAVELDLWKDYVLLGIDEGLGVEPLYFLKMICPSTKQIHLLRVPPNINSAKEAICWMNWSINLTDFPMQV